jgi:hypothetical protein
MNCCAECFGDRGLRRSIIPSRTAECGTCGYCGTTDVAILHPAMLAEYFQLVVSAYRPDTAGKFLVQLFREDWGLFEHPAMDDAHAKELLAEVLDDGEIVRRQFVPLPSDAADRLRKWEELRSELMYKNRFFPGVDVDLEGLEHLLSHLQADPDEVPRTWYRARIQTGDGAFDVREMGAPPGRNASHGRANPAGIPYLYVGSNPKTAVSEVRPHTGETVCVVDLATPKNLKVIDLRRPKKMVSAFILADAGAIARMRGDLPFLERLGEELTRPVVPQAAAIDYTPTQYICEFIKKCGYDGLLYRSSVSDGMNLALFDPAQVTFGTVRQYAVARVSVDIAIAQR